MDLVFSIFIIFSLSFSLYLSLSLQNLRSHVDLYRSITSRKMRFTEKVTVGFRFYFVQTARKKILRAYRAPLPSETVIYIYIYSDRSADIYGRGSEVIFTNMSVNNCS